MTAENEKTQDRILNRPLFLNFVLYVVILCTKKTILALSGGFAMTLSVGFSSR